MFGLTTDAVMALPMRFLRTWYFRLFVKSCGGGVFVGRHIDLRAPWGITIGNNVVINKRVLLDGRHGLEIGSNVDIAQDVYIWSRHHDYNDDYHSGVGAKTVIGDYVWLCARSNILPGVTVERGAVVATGAVVTRDVPPMAVVGGIPAKTIMERKSKLLYQLDFNPPFYDKN